MSDTEARGSEEWKIAGACGIERLSRNRNPNAMKREKREICCRCCCCFGGLRTHGFGSNTKAKTMNNTDRGLIHTYVSIYRHALCMYVICMVCMYVWMDGWMDGWIDGWMDGSMDGWINGWMDGWINGSMDVCFPHCFASKHMYVYGLIV